MTYQRHRPNNRASLKMLRVLPPIFDLSDIERLFEMSNREAAQTCSRWRSNELVKSIGPRVGVYYNHLTHPGLDDIKGALERVVRYPHVVIGGSSLHHANWTTQIPRRTEVGVPVTAEIQSYPEMDDAVLSPRPAGWINRVWKVSKPGVAGIMTAPPEYALIDIILSQNGMIRKGRQVWHAAPDDISPEIDDPVDVIERCYKAAQDMDAPLDLVQDYLRRVPALTDYVDDVDLPGTARHP